MTEKKIIKIKLSEKSVEELLDLGEKLGLHMKGDREYWKEFYSKEQEALFG